jgi:rhodanese-related sulfurtransferase
MCGRNISSERTSTIGHEKQFNYAVQPMSREDFIRLMTTDLPAAPAYFSRDAQINMEGAPELEELPAPSALSPADVQRLQADGALILDTRPSAQYATAHIRGSLHIALSGQFASWAGSLLQATDRLVLVAEDDERIREARMRLSRVGLDKVSGFLEGGILAWDRAGLPLASTEQISVQELSHRLSEHGVDHLLDVRRSGTPAISLVQLKHR